MEGAVPGQALDVRSELAGEGPGASGEGIPLPGHQRSLCGMWP